MQIIIKAENKHGFSLHQIPLNFENSVAENIISLKLPHKAIINYISAYYHLFKEKNLAQILQDTYDFITSTQDCKHSFYLKSEKEEKTDA